MYIALLIFLSFLSLFPYINGFPFTMEEGRRATVAFEMSYFNKYFQPTLLGDLYFNKPPFFNWLIILYSKFLGWDIITVRAVSLTFTLLNTLLVSLFTYRIFKNIKISLLAGLVFITFSDVLYWYGWLAEIDITLTFFVFLLFILIYEYFKSENHNFILLSGILTGIIFMLKGFPAFAFFGLSLIALATYKRNLFILLRPYFILSYVLAIVWSFWWIPLSDEPCLYFKRLWNESFSRVESSANFYKFLEHLISYPLLHVKQLFPASFVFFAILLTKFKEIKIPNDLKFLVILIGFNYIPYIISAKSEGRYVLPLFPIIAILFAYLIENYGDKFKKAFYLLVIFSIVGRFLYGYFFLPYLDIKRGKPKETAILINKLVGERKLACDCLELKNFCVYFNFLRNEAIIKSKYTENWEFLLDCKKRQGLNLLKKYRINKKDVYLYTRAYESIYVNNLPNNFSILRSPQIFKGLHLFGRGHKDGLERSGKIYGKNL